MRKTLMIASLTAFAAVAAFAAPRDTTFPQIPNTTEEIAANTGDVPVADFTKAVDEKAQGCGCGKGKPKAPAAKQVKPPVRSNQDRRK